MLGYATRRLLMAPLVLLAVITITFLLVRLAPGGPFDHDRVLPPDVRANLDARYGLDTPLHRQYLSYVGGLLHGDLGPSLRYRDQAVSQVIMGGLPATLTLGGLAWLIAAGLGIPLGALAAARRGSWLDHAASSIAAIGIAIPVFVVAPLGVLAFAVGLGWVPTGGWEHGRPSDVILPAVALAIPVLANLLRLTRSATLETLSAPHVLGARARGLGPTRVLFGHVLPAALAPVIAYLGPATAGILAGSLVVESVFSIPGVGRHRVQGALNRDYTLVLGMVIFYAALVLVANLVADLLQAWTDPRLRSNGA